MVTKKSTATMSRIHVQKKFDFIASLRDNKEIGEKDQPEFACKIVQGFCHSSKIMDCLQSIFKYQQKIQWHVFKY